MKHFFFFLFFAACCLTACNNNAQTTSPASSSSAGKTSDANTPAKPVSANDITGSWKLAIDAFDENDDEILQDEERKKGTANNYLFQFNKDGTCRLQGVFKGRYSIKTENGNKVLTVQRERIAQEESEDPLPDVYHIKSQTSDELVLLQMDGNDGISFWIFKRVA